MEQRTAIEATYRDIIDETERKLHRAKQRIYRIGTLRLLLFVAGIALAVYFRQEGTPVVVGILVGALVPFLYLVKRHNKLFYKREYLEKKVEVTRQELSAMAHDFSSFDGGEAFIDPAHVYTYDLDVFGTHSLFQYINRTATEPGKQRLADWFNARLRSKEAIEERQEAVQELTPDIRTRQHFRILGLLYKGTPADAGELREWVEAPVHFNKHLLLRMLPGVIFLANVLLIGLWLAGVLPSTFAGAFFVGCIIASSFFSKRITHMQELYSKKLQILGTYARLIRIIEEAPMECKALSTVQKLVSNDESTASLAVAQLGTLMDDLDKRNNVIVAVLLNGLFFWELRKIMQIEGWKQAHANRLPQWLEAIAEMDAYCSLATFAYNHPDYVYPVICSEPFRMEAKALGHPLMQRDKCVRNDITMSSRPYFLIITGANMAGKSTYLRTIGVNYLLACMGVPVWADSLQLYPAQLVTSLRTTDSLTDNESYFFAELKRLQRIIHLLQQGEQLFIILDEILKGTNSVDKQKGSLALVKQLIALQANGVIATHDLLLGTLIDTFPEHIRNHCFEADIRSNELTFSYQMRQGVAQNMNACFLMKKMGIVMDDK